MLHWLHSVMARCLDTSFRYVFYIHVIYNFVLYPLERLFGSYKQRPFIQTFCTRFVYTTLYIISIISDEGHGVCRTVCWQQPQQQQTLNLRVTGLCEGNPPLSGGFLSQRASNAESVSMSRRHHDVTTINHFRQIQNYYAHNLYKSTPFQRTGQIEYSTSSAPDRYRISHDTKSNHHKQLTHRQWWHEHLPLFRVRSWNNGMRCMSLYILMGNMTTITADLQRHFRHKHKQVDSK